MPDPIMIEAPARCETCGARHQSPTTGWLMNVCHCGGELKPEPDDSYARAIKVDPRALRISPTKFGGDWTRKR